MAQRLLFDQCLNLGMSGAQVFYWPNWLGCDEHDRYWHAFQNLNWVQSTFSIYGRTVPIPRLNAWYSDLGADYAYSGISLQRNDWTPELVDLKHKIERQTDSAYNAVLANWYRTGQDSVDWHADDEPELGPQPMIASVSLGGERTFKFRHRHNKLIAPVSLKLLPGSLLLMSGDTQRNWVHQVPKTKKQVESRINLTFRTII